ncbi:MAG TPA: hypothetical protein DHV16_01125 [Nitrospiraceae bacterium]|nr:hypothetical protein [Nitrospiraceae bacterium]
MNLMENSSRAQAGYRERFQEDTMRIDMHCHVIGNGTDIRNTGNDVYLYAEDNQLLFTRILAELIEISLKEMKSDLNNDGEISTGEYFDLLYKLLCSSGEIDGMVLLALDAVYSPKTGLLDERKTDLWVSNRFLAEKVEELNERLQKEPAPINKKRFFFGASVSPNRKDWEAELSYVINKTGAVLMKWIPSTQHIHLADYRHKDFYKALSGANMPLLCHVGPEYSFPEGIKKRDLDNYKYLESPLVHGVTVIAAHCAAPVFPVIDENTMPDFYALMKNANSGSRIRLWADTSALSLSTRLPFIQEIRSTFPPEWLMHGSDFPIPVGGGPYSVYSAQGMTPAEYIEKYIELYREMRKTKNPLDIDVKIKRAHGFSEEIISNADKVLRIPAMLRS